MYEEEEESSGETSDKEEDIKEPILAQENITIGYSEKINHKSTLGSTKNFQHWWRSAGLDLSFYSDRNFVLLKSNHVFVFLFHMVSIKIFRKITNKYPSLIGRETSVNLVEESLRWSSINGSGSGSSISDKYQVMAST